MDTIKIKPKKSWEVSRGPQPHKRGEVFQDKRQKRLRTRQAQNRQAIRENM